MQWSSAHRLRPCRGISPSAVGSRVRTRATVAAAVTVSGLLVAGLTSPPPATAAALSGVTCTVEMVPMRDGVRLATEVYKPPASGKFPVIMERSPYNGHSVSDNASNCDQPQLQTMASAGVTG
jgi:predicted acyl esterase